MNTDTYFNQGSTHRICEDYALASPGQVVIADGCSTGVHTDFGARLIAAAATQQNRQSLRNDERWSRILASADVYRKSVGMPVSSLAATLLIARFIDGDLPTIGVDIIGDGTVAARRRDTGVYDVYNVNFPSNAPYYLRYHLSDEDQKLWGEKFGWERTVTTCEWHPDWDLPKNTKSSTFGEPEMGIIAQTYNFPLNLYDLVAITSDGAESFLTSTESGDTTRVSMFEIFKQVLGFKNTRGEFVHKRCIKAFRQFAINGWENADDFSLAAIAGDP